MKERVFFFIKHGVFWLLFFELSRLLFLLYNSSQSASLTWTDMLIPFGLGFRMDISMASYWVILTGLLMAASPFLSHRLVVNTQQWISGLLLFISVFIIVVDFELYRHWGFRIDASPLLYIQGGEITGIGWVQLVMVLVLMFCLTALGWIVLRDLAKSGISFPKLKPIYGFVWLLITACLFFPIRGGIGVAPMNVSVVYFHKTLSFPNHLGINPVWNFFRSTASKYHFQYPTNLFSKEPYQGSLPADLPITHQKENLLITQERPNIILIILESFTAKIIPLLQGLDDGVTPGFTSLCKEGILFADFYASGDRTGKGLVALLSAYPAQPTTSIITFPKKIQLLPFIPRELKKMGYHTHFAYGGDIHFANIRSYLVAGGFDAYSYEKDFPSEVHRSKWGVADHEVFNQFLHICDTISKPFFNVILTLSNHEPFDVPMQPLFKGTDEVSLFLNACHYTDQSMYKFIQEAKKKSWWKNTWVIITADHGHRLPNQTTELKDKKRFHIPMLWLGGVLKKQDTIIHNPGSHTDLAATIFGQLNRSDISQSFPFSQDMLHGATPFAVYVFNNGFGYYSHTSELVYDLDWKKIIQFRGDSTSWKNGSLFMHTLFNDYNQR